MLCVHGYHRSRGVGSLFALNAFFVIGLLAKEVALAMVPMVALYWWYLRIEQRADAAVEPSDPPSVLGYWGNELRMYWAALTQRASDWLRLLGPMIVVFGIYFAYRQAVLPGDSFGGRFAETQNPLSGFFGGVRSTLAGVPWEVRSLAFWPFIAAIVLAFVVAPRARAWRVVLLGLGLAASGVLPLTFSGGVEPRLLYVAEIGVAVMIAGLVTVFATASRTERQQPQRRIWFVAAAALAIVFTGATLVSLVRAQNVFQVGSQKMLDGDLQMYERPFLHPYIVPVHFDALEQRLVEAGMIDLP